ncbi:MAG: hypothetical protein ACRCZ9_02450 [Fusobacteriaceae bacterium]
MNMTYAMTNKIAIHFGKDSEVHKKIEDTLPSQSLMDQIDFSESKLGYISFLHCDKNGKIASRKRQDMKIGAFFNKFIDVNSKTNSKIMEQFVADVLSKEYYIEVLHGNNSIEWSYNLENNMPNCGTLNYSCMREPEYCKDGIEFYDEISSIKVAVLKRIGESKIFGRAILWHGIKDNLTNNTINLMDKPYCCTSKLPLFNNFAKENKYVQTNKDIDVEFKLPKVTKCFPHLDTFCYLINDVKNGTQKIRSKLNTKIKEMRNKDLEIVGIASGEIMWIVDETKRYCAYCGNAFYVMDSFESDYCDSCHDELDIRIYVSLNEEYGHAEFKNLYLCSECNTYHLKKEMKEWKIIHGKQKEATL